MASYFDLNKIISFIRHYSYNEYSKDIETIIKKYDMSSLIPITLPNGIIICYNVNSFDIVSSILEYDENITSLLLFNITLSCENLVKICNLINEKVISNLYFVKCTFINNSENGMTINDYMDQITEISFINSICIETENIKSGNGLDILFNCMFKIIPFHFKFVEHNTLTNDEFQVFNRLLNYYNSKRYYIDLQVCNLLEDNFKQFLETLRNNTSIVNLSLAELSSLQSMYFTPDYKDDKKLFLQLIDILSKNTSITSLNLSDLTFNYSDGIGNALSTLLKQNTTLTSLYLSKCHIGFYYNKHSHRDVPIYEEAFYKALKENTTLTSLSMTIYSYDIMESIAKSLSENSGLLELKLDTHSKAVYNNFDTIIEPLINNTTLTSLSLIRYTSKDEWEMDEDCPSYYKVSYP